MAQDVRAFTVTVPAGTTKAAGWSASLTMPPRVVREVEVKVPPGPRGEVGFAIGAAGTPIIPAETGAWIITDNEEINWRLDGYLSSGAWQVFAYNTGSYPHTLHFRFLCDVLGSDAVAPEPPPNLVGSSGTVESSPSGNGSSTPPSPSGGNGTGSGLPGDTGQPPAGLPPVSLPPLPTPPPPVIPPAPTQPPPPVNFPPLPPIPPIVIPPLPPITIPPLPPLGGPQPSGTPPVYPRALEPFFAAHVIAALVFGRGVGIGTVQQIAADVGQLGEQRALTKWASVAAHGGEITLLERVPNLKTDHLHPAQHVHNAKQIA